MIVGVFGTACILITAAGAVWWDRYHTKLQQEKRYN